MADNYVNPENTQKRTDNSYRKVLEKIQGDKVCPFCREELNKYHKNPILFENNSWLITKNMYPYKNTNHHFLLIHKAHITSSEEMGQEAAQDLFAVINWAKKEFAIPGATFFMRFGDTRYTGASVSHLHGQLVSSDPFESGYEPVVARIA